MSGVTEVRCQTCPTKVEETAGAARALGWRIWTGTTMGGTERTVVICPACIAGQEDGPPRGFDAECSTCFTSMSDDWADEKPAGGWTEEDAEGWASDHQCEPDTTVIRPKVKGAAA